MSDITLPVSIGEALDKLTILDIKCSKITDSDRKAHCTKEYTLLFDSLKQYVTDHRWLYDKLLEVNLSIWDEQDKFHGKETTVSEVELGRICSQILKENDRRFRIKAKINHIVSSSIHEVKGYAKKKVFFYGHLGLGDMFWMCGAVRYLATCYDETIVVCKRKYSENVKAMYADDPSIKLYLVDDEVRQMYPFLQVVKPRIESNGYTVLACGGHIRAPIVDFPYSFYDNINVPRDYMKKWFFIPTMKEATELYNAVTALTDKYVLVHQQSSTKTIDIWNKVSAKTNIPVLDLNKNYYSADHPFFPIAEIVANKPLLHLKTLIENATELYMIESSIYCMSSLLDLSKVGTKHCFNTYDNSNERIGVFTATTL